MGSTTVQCGQCQHWDHDYQTSAEYGHLGACYNTEKIIDVESVRIIPLDTDIAVYNSICFIPLLTGPEFGCVHGEMRGIIYSEEKHE